jgi:hypothetical protein
MRSKTLTDYLKKRERPQILCGIDRPSNKEELQEAKAFDLEKSEHFPLMARSVRDLPSAEGYQYRSHGLWVAPSLDHIMYRSSGEKKIFPVEQYHKVNAYALERSHKFVSEVQAVSKDLGKEYNMYQSHHIGAINAYTKDSMGGVNDKLTKGSRLSPEHRKGIERLDDAAYTHTTPHALTLWSGISPEHASKVVNNDQVHHPAYLSTSLSPHVAAAFTRFKAKDEDGSEGIEGHMLKILVPHGHPGAFIGHVSMVHNEKGEMGEHEFILPRDTVLNIHHDKRLYAPMPHSDGKSFFTIHHATIEPKP